MALDRLDSRVVACVHSLLVESMPDVAILNPDDVHMWFSRAQSVAQWRVISRSMARAMEWHTNLNDLYREHLVCFNAYLHDLYTPDYDSDGNVWDSLGPRFGADWE